MKKLFAISFLSIFLLCNCGQTGPLVLPPEKGDSEYKSHKKS